MKKLHTGGGGLGAVSHGEAGDGYGRAGLGCGAVVDSAAAAAGPAAVAAAAAESEAVAAAAAESEAVAAAEAESEADSVAPPKRISPLDRIELPTGACLGWVFARGWKGTRQRIVVGPAEGASYHIMSRTAGGERLLGDTEKEALRRLMWRMARFFGLEIHTCAVMENHFHINLNPLRAGMVKDPKDYRKHFSPRRTSGARALREDAQASLFSACQLTVRTVG